MYHAAKLVLSGAIFATAFAAVITGGEHQDASRASAIACVLACAAVALVAFLGERAERLERERLERELRDQELLDKIPYSILGGAKYHGGCHDHTDE